MPFLVAAICALATALVNQFVLIPLCDGGADGTAMVWPTLAHAPAKTGLLVLAVCGVVLAVLPLVVGSTVYPLPFLSLIHI